MQFSSQHEDTEYERRPLTIKQFQQLMRYLDTFELKMSAPKIPLTAGAPELEPFWTAVKSAFREGERCCVFISTSTNRRRQCSVEAGARSNRDKRVHPHIDLAAH